MSGWMPNPAATEKTLVLDANWERVTVTDSFTREEKPIRFVCLSVEADRQPPSY